MGSKITFPPLRRENYRALLAANAIMSLLSSKIPHIETVTLSARGKLLLTAEYFVLDGVLALALPTKYGQTFRFEPVDGPLGQIHWRSYNNLGELWFEGIFATSAEPIILLGDTAIAQRLTQIFQAISQLSGGWPVATHAIRIESRLDFPAHWGLGTSSTLIAALAKWAGVDAFRLLDATFGGSGYDLACAFADGPILYQRRENTGHWTPAAFAPPFHEQLYFVGLGAKQNSREGIARYRNLNPPPAQKLLQEITQITKAFLHVQAIGEFENFLQQHEDLVSKTLGLPPIAKTLFPDYPGAMKSLGAWGGDFALATSHTSVETTLQYFADRGYPEVVRYRDMVIG